MRPTAFRRWMLMQWRKLDALSSFSNYFGRLEEAMTATFWALCTRDQLLDADSACWHDRGCKMIESISIQALYSVSLNTVIYLVEEDLVVDLLLHLSLGPLLQQTISPKSITQVQQPTNSRLESTVTDNDGEEIAIAFSTANKNSTTTKQTRPSRERRPGGKKSRTRAKILLASNVVHPV